MKRAVDLGEGVVVEVHELSSGLPGPTLAVLGGVHGDELEGVIACQLVQRRLLDAPAFRGTVRIVPVCNPPAHAVRQRLSPLDGANLARVFPGDPDGTATERIAHQLTTEVIAGADLLVDLHSAGVRYEMPVFAGYVADGVADDRARDATYAFGAPTVWEHHASGPGRSLSAAAELHIPSMYVEGSGGGGLVGSDLDVYVEGVLRLMGFLGMSEVTTESPVEPRRLVGGEGDTDASLSCTADGYCVTRVRSGDIVDAGAVIADIVAADGRLLEQVCSPQHGTVMMLRRQAEVRAGDGIVMFGPVPETVRQ